MRKFMIKKALAKTAPALLQACKKLRKAHSALELRQALDLLDNTITVIEFSGSKVMSRYAN